MKSNINAFLMMLRKCEGTAGTNGYNITYGYHYFSDLSKHPNIRVPFMNPRTHKMDYSTAAGAYQFIYSTWHRIAAKYGIKDFSRLSQDAAAIGQIKECGAYADILAGRLQTAINKTCGIWASLPGSTAMQNPKSYATAKSNYLAAGGVVA